MHAFIEKILGWESFFHGLDWWGVMLYALIVVVLQMFCAPLAPFAVAAGVIFGLGRGVTAIQLGTGLGAAVNFLISRHFARGLVSRWLSHHEKFRLIDAAIGREGWKIIALLRLCPMPFGLANYSYGLTSVAFVPYMLATFFPIIPANFFFVYLGTTSREALAAVSGTAHTSSPWEMGFKVVGLVAVFCAITYVTKVARAAIARGEPQPDPERVS